MRETRFDVLVVGGGHAGAEAAWAAANAGRATALVTMDPNKIGQMSCNPAIGGLAKGQMVREIDALGGLMGLAIDATGIQFRVLNASRGPAVRGPRAQADKYAYAREVRRLLGTRPNLTILTGTVEAFRIERGRCVGLTYTPPADRRSGSAPLQLHADAVVLTTGTFMRGLMHTGEAKTKGGRTGEKPAMGISRQLEQLGFELGRLKTGTPPRLSAETVDLKGLPRQTGDAPPRPFSEMTGAEEAYGDPAYTRVGNGVPVLEQRPCWMTRTHESIHDLIRANLHRAPMYNGQIDTVGPRYCPSIEDKVVRFSDKPSHHVFLEPESLETEELYCNGIASSLPSDVQERIVRGLPGCERARILRFGYAVEYDMVLPYQIDVTGMTKRFPGLFLAGQINGTTGYEEAAVQGLVAGANAARWSEGENPIRLCRDQAYIGVLMDDLVTKVPQEPYRMFTSRAEHRLALRADNAPQRLTPLGREWGLVDDRRWERHRKQADALASLREVLRTRRDNGKRLYDKARRPDMGAEDLLARLADEPLPPAAREPSLVDVLLSEIKYEGFVEQHRRERERLKELEHAPLPTDMDYERLTDLRLEARQVLNRFRPATLGQAGRLAGVNPADLTVLRMAVGRR